LSDTASMKKRKQMFLEEYGVEKEPMLKKGGRE
jgi:hypothetical protein